MDKVQEQLVALSRELYTSIPKDLEFYDKTYLIGHIVGQHIYNSGKDLVSKGLNWDDNVLQQIQSVIVEVGSSYAKAGAYEEKVVKPSNIIRFPTERRK
ncbi:MAG: hypothetical protein KDH96_01870 [Candidatus Riesia sp.]|nr:hypothetical protein [Candidatus Riesia sp.]